jgi:hypothetical protein
MEKKFVIPPGAQAMIPESERVRPLWIDVSLEYDVFLVDPELCLQQTMQWFMSRYGSWLFLFEWGKK